MGEIHPLGYRWDSYRGRPVVRSYGDGWFGYIPSWRGQNHMSQAGLRAPCRALRPGDRLRIKYDNGQQVVVRLKAHGAPPETPALIPSEASTGKDSA